MEETKQQTDQKAPSARTAAQEIAEYEANLYKAQRDLRAARKTFKARLSR